MTHRHDDDNIYPNVQTQTRELLKRFDAAPRTPTRTTVVETIGNILIAAILGLMFAWVGIN